MSNPYSDHRLMNTVTTRPATREEKIVNPGVYEVSVQEPVAGCACRWDEEGDRTVTCERHQGWLEVIAEWAERAREAEAKLKATPPAAQRQWVGLTDEERTEIRREHYARTIPLMDAIEATLREKNGGAA